MSQGSFNELDMETFARIEKRLDWCFVKNP